MALDYFQIVFLINVKEWLELKVKKKNFFLQFCRAASLSYFFLVSFSLII